jgi:hypothetical protein
MGHHMRRNVRNAVLLSILLFAPAWIHSAQQTSKTKQAKGAAAVSERLGNADAITQEELKGYEYFLASDQLEGRNSPSRGYDTAALYIASHMHQWGLKSGGSQEGTTGPLQPYFVPIELASSRYDAAGMNLTLTIPPRASGRGGAAGGRGFGAPAIPPGPHDYEYGKEWMAGSTMGGFGGRGGVSALPAEVTGAALVFAGNGYILSKTNTDPYKGMDVRGKIIVIAGLPPELSAARAAGAAGAAGGRGRGGAAANPLGIENTDFITPQGYASKNGALAILMVPTYQQLSLMANADAGGGRGAGLNGPSYQVVKFQSSRPESVPVITAGIELTNALFQGEKLSGAQVFEGATANSKLESFELNADKKLSFKIAVTTDRNHTENVAAMIEGSDPVLKNEYVVLSAHLDHVGLAAPDNNGDGINNGADDDASGCAGLMAIARALAEGAEKGMRPKRTVIFLWVAGEEKGLWGSQYFNQFPSLDIKKVVVNLNVDMIGRSKPQGYSDPPSYKLVESGEVFLVGPRISSDELGKMLESINGNYQKLKFNDFYDVTAPDATHDNLGPQPSGQRIFYRSDHYNFAKMGIPVAFFTTGLHSDYHRVSDSPDRIDYQQMLAITKTLAAAAWQIANTAAPPKLNSNLPERLVNDMKAAQEQEWGKLTPAIPPLPGMPY